MTYAQNPDNQTTIEISFFEIYNEKVFDLLSDKTEPINSKGSKFTGGVKRPLTNFLDAELVLIEGIFYIRFVIISAAQIRSMYNLLV